jgi:hypothetical protein
VCALPSVRSAFAAVNDAKEKLRQAMQDLQVDRHRSRPNSDEKRNVLLRTMAEMESALWSAEMKQ